MSKDFSEQNQLEWIELQKKALRLASTDAVRLISDFIDKTPDKSLRREALAFRASLHTNVEHFDLARKDLLEAHAASDQAGYFKYSLEIYLASLYRSQQLIKESESWAIHALETAAEDPSTSGAGALRQLLTLRGEQGIEEHERHLVAKVVHQAWSLFSLEGSPDFGDLSRTVDTLLEAQQRPFSQDRPPRPKPWDG